MNLALWLAILAVALVPFVPNLLRVRIRVLHWMHWDRAANMHEKYFNGLCLGVRIALLLTAATLAYFAM